MVSAMLLKPRVAHDVAAILGGLFISYLGAVSVVMIWSAASLIPAIFVMLGLLLIFGGSIRLARRNRLALTIDRSGISLPVGNIFRGDLRNIVVPRQAMAAIYRYESLRGRLIMIGLINGQKIPIQARMYCELKNFLSRCEQFDLPVI